MGGILERMGEKTNTWNVFVLFRIYLNYIILSILVWQIVKHRSEPTNYRRFEDTYHLSSSRFEELDLLRNVWNQPPCLSVNIPEEIVFLRRGWTKFFWVITRREVV